MSLLTASLAAAAGWSTPATISPIIALGTPSAFANDPAGNQVWVTRAAVTGGVVVQAAQRPAGGAWSGPTRIEPSTWYVADNDAIATDAAGNVTAAWLVEDASGTTQVRAVTRSVGGAWGTVVSLGPCTTTIDLCSTPQVAASRDGSLTVVGWAAYGSSSAPNVAVRTGSGAWTRTVLSSGNAQVVYALASNNAHASAVWPETAPGRHKVVLKQSDY